MKIICKDLRNWINFQLILTKVDWFTWNREPWGSSRFKQFLKNRNNPPQSLVRKVFNKIYSSIRFHSTEITLELEWKNKLTLNLNPSDLNEREKQFFFYYSCIVRYGPTDLFNTSSCIRVSHFPEILTSIITNFCIIKFESVSHNGWSRPNNKSYTLLVSHSM